MAETSTNTRKRGRPPVDVRYDNWYGVQDPRERKKIQDRLAQRARRKRIGAVNSKTVSKPAPSSHDGPQDSLQDENAPIACTKREDDVHELLNIPDQSRLIVFASKRAAHVVPYKVSEIQRSPSVQPVGLDHWFLCWPAWSIYAALTSHGLMLGTSCADCVHETVSVADFDHLPEHLRPSPLQLAVSHRRWIDRFPFPRLRDNMILLRALINLDQFCGDLFNTASLTLRPSCPTWDQKSWIMGDEFASRWGYLFR